jgi:hypothetical protein
MRVEVVHHQDHFPGSWVMYRQQFFDEMGLVFLRATLCHLEIPFTLACALRARLRTLLPG